MSLAACQLALSQATGCDDKRSRTQIMYLLHIIASEPVLDTFQARTRGLAQHAISYVGTACAALHDIYIIYIVSCKCIVLSKRATCSVRTAVASKPTTLYALPVLPVAFCFSLNFTSPQSRNANVYLQVPRLCRCLHSASLPHRRRKDLAGCFASSHP